MNDAAAPRGADATPAFVAGREEGLRAFWEVYEARYDDVQRLTLQLALDHPDFGPIVRSMPADVQLEQNKRSRAILRAAVVDGKWAEYVADLRTQGALYAKIGISFVGWYDIVRAFKRALVPALVEAYGASPDRLVEAVGAMLEFIDFAMSTIAEQYLVTKKDVRFRALTESAADAILTADSRGRVTYANASAQAMFGRSAEELAGSPIGAIIPVLTGAEDRKVLEALLARHLATSAAKTIEGTGLRARGVAFPMELSLSGWDETSELAFAVIARDVTDRKRADEALLRAKNVAEGATRELEAFSYSVAHDLRAPLRGINGFARALLEDLQGTLDPASKSYLDRICAGTERMGRLIDALLALSRVTRVEIKREIVNLSEVAASTVAQLRAAYPDRVVHFDGQEGLTVYGDAALLRALFENLLGNAWKFTGRRDVAHVSFGRTEVDGVVAYRIADDGAGFDMEYADKLFAPFQRLHANAQFAGTGIGLATVQRIVRRHGGRIWAHGRVDAGAEFLFTLANEPTGVAP